MWFQRFKLFIWRGYKIFKSGHITIQHEEKYEEFSFFLEKKKGRKIKEWKTCKVILWISNLECTLPESKYI